MSAHSIAGAWAAINFFLFPLFFLLNFVSVFWKCHNQIDMMNDSRSMTPNCWQSLKSLVSIVSEGPVHSKIEIQNNLRKLMDAKKIESKSAHIYTKMHGVKKVKIAFLEDENSDFDFSFSNSCCHVLLHRKASSFHIQIEDINGRSIDVTAYYSGRKSRNKRLLIFRYQIIHPIEWKTHY